MEHSALHVLLLTGLILTLGGPVAVLWLILPAGRNGGPDAERDALVEAFIRSIARWTMFGALASALATFIDLFVQVAEVHAQTVFAGVDLGLVVRYATATMVGRLSLIRMGLLLLTAGVARLGGRRVWWLTGVLALAAVTATSLVSHAAAQPEHRLVGVIIQIAHVVAGSLWMGVLLQLFLARGQMFGDATTNRVGMVAEIVRRFSPLALAMTSLLGFTGLFVAYRYLQTPGAVFTSPYGLTLLVKLALIAPAIYAGYVNFRQIRPQLLRVAADNAVAHGLVAAPGSAWGAVSVFRRFNQMLELEVTAGLLVITVAGILGSVSPPGDDGSARLTAAQGRAVLTPHLPQTNLKNWKRPDDPRGPTEDDLRYSEFTHNWSGVTVCLLGLAWLGQGVGGRIGVWGGRFSALVLVPFGLFIAVAANPELYLLHQVPLRKAITDPILLEHQLGAVMVFILARLTWQDQHRREDERPLGYALPVIMIVGSLLLLGHAHSAFTVTDELTNLINVQHAVFGAFGLFAGTTRLLVLRGLVKTPLMRCAWAGFVIALGLFMAFMYREVV